MRRAILTTAAVLVATTTWAQNSPITVSPDAQSVLVQKNIGISRWAIVQDRANRTVTGNIFNPEGGAQFVWCEFKGGTTYDCFGSNGCGQEPCDWAILSTVELPDSFFAVQPTPYVSPRPTPVPTPRPTTQPTAPPASGLQGLIGTWDFTFSILITFTDTLRLQRVENRGGIPFIFGVDEAGRPIFGGFREDILSGSGVLEQYDFAVINIGPVICQLYVFDRTGDFANGLYSLTDPAGDDDCEAFTRGYQMTGRRTSRTASLPERPASVASRALRRGQRARLLDARAEVRLGDAGVTLPPEFDALARELIRRAREARPK